MSFFMDFWPIRKLETAQWGGPPRPPGELRIAHHIQMSAQTAIFVILSLAKNLFFVAVEIRNEAALRSE
jgi:hypothetical protein